MLQRRSAAHSTHRDGSHLDVPSVPTTEMNYERTLSSRHQCTPSPPRPHRLTAAPFLSQRILTRTIQSAEGCFPPGAGTNQRAAASRRQSLCVLAGPQRPTRRLGRNWSARPSSVRHGVTVQSRAEPSRASCERRGRLMSEAEASPREYLAASVPAVKRTLVRRLLHVGKGYWQ